MAKIMKQQSDFDGELDVTPREEELLETLRGYCCVVRDVIPGLNSYNIMEVSAKPVVNYIETNTNPTHTGVADRIKLYFKGIMDEMEVPKGPKEMYSSTLERELNSHGDEIDKMIKQIREEAPQVKSKKKY